MRDGIDVGLIELDYRLTVRIRNLIGSYTDDGRHRPIIYRYQMASARSSRAAKLHQNKRTPSERAFLIRAICELFEFLLEAGGFAGAAAHEIELRTADAVVTLYHDLIEAG